jgi:hypothetical protein
MGVPQWTTGPTCAGANPAQADLRELRGQLRAAQAGKLQDIRDRVALRRVQREGSRPVIREGRADPLREREHPAETAQAAAHVPSVVQVARKPTVSELARTPADVALPPEHVEARPLAGHTPAASPTRSAALLTPTGAGPTPLTTSPRSAPVPGSLKEVAAACRVARSRNSAPARQTVLEPSTAGPPGLFVGRRLVGQTGRDALLIPLENLAKHTVVLAGAGSGKTVLVRRIVEEAALLGVPSVVVDGANDLSRLAEPWPAPPASFDEEDRSKAARYAATAEVIVWTPGRRDGNPLALDPLPCFRDLAGDEEYLESATQMARACLEPIAALSKGPAGKVKAGLLASALRHFGSTGGGSLGELVELLADLPAEARAGFDRADKLGRDLADALRAEMATNPLIRGYGASLDPAVLLQARGSGKTRVSVVNLSGLADLAAQQQFVNQLAMTMFTWIKKNPPKGQALRGLLVVDEARDFVPAGKSAPSKESLIRLVAQARKYGLGMVFATQAPKSIDHNIIVNCSTQFFGRTNSPAAIETAQEQLQLRGARGEDIARLQQGWFYAFSEGLPGPLKIQVPLCLSHHPPNPLDEGEIQLLAAGTRQLA